MPSEQRSPAPSEAVPRSSATRRNPYVGPRALRQGEHIYGCEREAIASWQFGFSAPRFFENKLVRRGTRRARRSFPTAHPKAT